MHSEVKASDPPQSARDAGLRYVSDTHPGIQRKRQGRGFRYIGVDGKPVRDPEVLGRIKSLVIPPAWKQVWICTDPKGHLQATGRDAKGRKQSKYHPRWREVRDETKYEHMLLFAAALPAIREQVERDLALHGVPRRKVLATIVRLMKTTYIRVGNTEYARENHSYGLTTMRGRHVHVDGSKITFKFQGKSGVHHTVDLQDRRLARIILQCQDLPGYELFQFVGDDGETHAVDSADVNDYLREISGHDFTAKDFRTWAGTVLASVALQECDAFETESQAKKNVVRAIQSVAERLGNTPSVCRKCYVHPAVLENYMSGAMESGLKRKSQQRRAHAVHGLGQEEKALIRLLKRKSATQVVRCS